MLQNLGGDKSAIGAGMAVALITTLYGAIVANLVAIPIANKLTERNDEEVLVKEIMIAGVLSIQAGENPRIVKEKLMSYLPPEVRKELQEQERAER
jgi:chemotaxis protein MotA